MLAHQKQQLEPKIRCYVCRYWQLPFFFLRNDQLVVPFLAVTCDQVVKAFPSETNEGQFPPLWSEHWQLKTGCN